MTGATSYAAYYSTTPVLQAATVHAAKTHTTSPHQHPKESTMPSFLKPCINCGTLTRGTRCNTHQQQLDQAKEKKRDTPERRAKKKAMYGWDYQQRRAHLRAQATHCHLCQQPFTSTDNIEADHLIPGDPHSPLAPAHRLCNQVRSNKPLQQRSDEPLQ